MFRIVTLLAFLTSASCENEFELFNLTLQPRAIELDEGNTEIIQFTLICNQLTLCNNYTTLDLTVDNQKIARIGENDSIAIDWQRNESYITEGSFSVEGVRLGRAYISFYASSQNDILEKYDVVYEVIVLRDRRVVDDVFRYGIIALASILYIGFGCKIDIKIVWSILKSPISPAIGFASQFIIMPLLGFGLGQAFALESSLAFGLLTMACSPGGGSSNVWVNLLGGDLDLSLTMTTISTFGALGMMPLWIYALGHFYLDTSEVDIPYFDVFRSLLTIVIPCAVGLIIRYFAPKIADPIAKFTRPFSGIFVLYILTFGTYVNLYMYEIMGDMTEVIPAAILLPSLGYLCGLLLAIVCKRSKSAAVTISIETGVQNASIPIIVLQGNFPQPEGDIAAVMPVASSLFYTFPLLFAWIAYTLHKKQHGGKTNPDVEEKGHGKAQYTSENTPSEISSRVSNENQISNHADKDNHYDNSDISYF